MTTTTSDSTLGKPTFYNYPPPKLGPKWPYKNETHPNPILRGYTLSVAASL